eukprot:8592297-Pyramimonas_sp.AAC.1
MELALHDVATPYIAHAERPSRYRIEGRFSRHLPDDLWAPVFSCLTRPAGRPLDDTRQNGH